MAKKSRKSGILSERQIQSKYPGAGKASDIMANNQDLLWIPSRCLPLNYATGGGFPYGKIIEIYGEESSGKTLVALDVASVVQALGGEIIFNDAEQAFTQDWAVKNGLDPERIHLYPQTAVEMVSDWLMDTAISIRSRLVKNEPILFIQDSIAALDCLDNINSIQSDSKAEMGNRAKAIYKMVRIRNQMLSELGVTSIFINQIRKKIGTNTFGADPDTTPGGQAMRFYASIRLGLYAGKQIKDKVDGYEDRVGSVTSIRVKKNKVAPPKPTFTAHMYFNSNYSKPLGFDRYFGLAELFIKLGVVQKKSGSTFIYYNDELIARGENSLELKLSKDVKLRKALIEASPINTISKTRKKLASLTGNHFPIKSRSFISQTKEEEDE